MLILPIKKKWFDMIKSGEKKEEYRETKPYWRTRFFKLFLKKIYMPNGEIGYLGSYNNSTVKEIMFRNGYKKDSPRIICKCRFKIGTGKEEWGAEKGKEYYILEILEIIGEKNEQS